MTRLICINTYGVLSIFPLTTRLAFDFMLNKKAVYHRCYLRERVKDANQEMQHESKLFD